MINNCVIIGRLTKDIELRKTQSGISTTTFTVASNRDIKNEQGGYDADFIQCVAWKHNADFLNQYAHKGDLIGVSGRIQTRTFDKRDGSKAYITEVNCNNVELLEKKQTEQGNQRHNNANQDNWNYTPEVNEDDMPF